MVNSISPYYYAAGVEKSDYYLSGLNFDAIPLDAVGLISVDNLNPLMNIHSMADENMYRIAGLTSTSMHLVAVQSGALDESNYLGAIVSPDGHTIYWMNNSKPLP